MRTPFLLYRVFDVHRVLSLFQFAFLPLGLHVSIFSSHTGTFQNPHQNYQLQLAATVTPAPAVTTPSAEIATQIGNATATNT